MTAVFVVLRRAASLADCEMAEDERVAGNALSWHQDLCSFVVILHMVPVDVKEREL